VEALDHQAIHLANLVGRQVRDAGLIAHVHCVYSWMKCPSAGGITKRSGDPGRPSPPDHRTAAWVDRTL
jgi:hypothetical protein